MTSKHIPDAHTVVQFASKDMIIRKQARISSRFAHKVANVYLVICDSEIQLSKSGKIAAECLNEILGHFSNVGLDSH